jgi:UDP-N-acetylglucosamine 2-epimerase (non-hydrolysing)/GDP/UDP-N,N'-diacetylbacillosamine 2-epimerase (hydrolysing)
MAVEGKTAKRICVVTGTRAEYGLLKPIMEWIQTAQLELRLVVAGMHLSHEFGNTYQVIEQDGFGIAARVDMVLSGDNNAAMTKSIGIGIYGMTQALEAIDPDVVLVLGDRVEAFSGAVSGAGLNRVVAHLHGGEVTRGGLDESMRHAITKFAHVHFVATERSRDRLLKMGEQPETIYKVGAPGLDSVLREKLYDLAELKDLLGVPIREPFFLVVQHPVSTDANSSAEQMKETLEALKTIGYQAVLIYPNSDAGGRRMIEVIESYRRESWLHIFRSLSRTAYLSLLKHAAALVGNSSSGIIEAPSFHLPVVNIGSRQEGRERSTNVLDVSPVRDEIRKTIHHALNDGNFRSRVRLCVNPYGDGKASQRVVEALCKLKITPQFLQKQLAY